MLYWPEMHIQTWSPQKDDEISDFGFDFPGMLEKNKNICKINAALQHLSSCAKA